MLMVRLFCVLSDNTAERALATLNYETVKGRCIRIMFVNKDPTGRRTGLGNIFIKKLDQSVDSKTLHDTFAQFGTVQSCKVLMSPLIIDG